MIKGKNIIRFHRRQICPTRTFQISGNAFIDHFRISRKTDGDRLRLVLPFRTSKENQIRRFGEDIFRTQRCRAFHLTGGDILAAQFFQQRAPHRVAIRIAERFRAILRKLYINFFRRRL